MAYFPSTLISDVSLSLKTLLAAVARPPWMDAATKRLNIQSVTALTTVTTVTTVAGQTNLGGVLAYGNVVVPTIHNNWANSIRRNIT